MEPVIKKRLFLFGLVTSGALALGLGLPRPWLPPLLRYTGYYFVLAGFVVWAVLVVRAGRGRWRALLKAHYPALLLAAGLMVLTGQLSPPQFKILGDEANLVGTSMSMHFEKTTAVPLHGLGLDYYHFDYHGRIDQRPLLFPFVVSLVHAGLGYSAYNGMVANLVIGGLLLFVFYLLLTRMFSRIYGLAGMLLLAAFPAFVFWVTASGFEVLNLFYLVVVLYVLYGLTRGREVGVADVRQVDRAELLFLSLVLLAQCRYESVLFFFGLVAAWSLLLDKKMIAAYRWPTLLVPLLLLPVLWQRRYTFFHAAVQSGLNSQTPEQVFSLSNLAEHLPVNLFVLSGLDPALGFMPVVALMAVPGLYLAGKKYILDFRTIRPENRVVAGFALLTVIPLFLLYAAFYWGNLSSPMDNRLAMVFLPFLVLPALYWLFRLSAGDSGQGRLLLIGLAVVLLLYYRPVAEQQRIIRGKSLTHEYNRVLDYLYANYDPGRQKILIISDRTNFYTIHQAGSLGFGQANQQAARLKKFDDIYYDHILALQRGNPLTNQLEPVTVLNESFILKPVKRIDVSPDNYVLISEADIRLPVE
ncbi:MAG: hypothetical protein ACLFS7_02395 [Desulfosudaceae bacterium]